MLLLKMRAGGSVPKVQKKRPKGKTRQSQFLMEQRSSSPGVGPKEAADSGILSSGSRSAGKDLFNALAPALDQDDQHNYRKDCGNNANKRYIVHVNSSFLSSKILVKTLHYGDGRRPQSHQKQGWKNKKYKREDKFDRCLRCLLLHFLPALGSERVGVNS